jgi:DNA-binding MarR family transcriptional regulator
MPTTKVADPTAVANRLRPALLRANRALRREVHSLGVTGGEVALLSLIRAEPGIGVRELATRERMSPAAMSKHIARLENAGLLRRTALPDRRRVGLVLTAEATRLLDSIKRRRTTWLASRLRELSPAEVAALDAAVEPLLKLADVSS